jgi:hypothetical protein
MWKTEVNGQVDPWWDALKVGPGAKDECKACRREEDPFQQAAIFLRALVSLKARQSCDLSGFGKGEGRRDREENKRGRIYGKSSAFWQNTISPENGLMFILFKMGNNGRRAEGPCRHRRWWSVLQLSTVARIFCNSHLDPSDHIEGRLSVNDGRKQNLRIIGQVDIVQAWMPDSLPLLRSPLAPESSNEVLIAMSRMVDSKGSRKDRVNAFVSTSRSNAKKRLLSPNAEKQTGIVHQYPGVWAWLRSRYHVQRAFEAFPCTTSSLGVFSATLVTATWNEFTCGVAKESPARLHHHHMMEGREDNLLLGS